MAVSIKILVFGKELMNYHYLYWSIKRATRNIAQIFINTGKNEVYF